MTVSWVSAWKRFPNGEQGSQASSQRLPEALLGLGVWLLHRSSCDLIQVLRLGADKLPLSPRKVAWKEHVLTLCAKEAAPSLCLCERDDRSLWPILWHLCICLTVRAVSETPVILSLCLRRQRASLPSAILRAHPVSGAASWSLLSLENKSNFLECKKLVSSFNHR